MWTCPFCDADLLEAGLREGRCPYCGGIINWSEESANVDAPSEVDRNAQERAAVESPLALASEQPNQAISDGSLPAGTSGHGEPHDSQVDQPNADNGGRRTAGSKHDDTLQLTAMWEEAASQDPNPFRTIKSDHLDVPPGSNLVIRSHQISRPGDGPGNEADYELLEVIGEGGMGVVYAARQAAIDRTVAIKMLRSGHQDLPDRQDKFLAEAVVTGELDHPNIVPVYDLGSGDDGEFFYSMKRVQGTPWDKVIRTNSTSENLEILLKVADAVAFAHSRGVIHRDIKPENVMIGDFGEVLVMDWGVALSTSLVVKMGAAASSSSMGGTPAYMAPEMATGPIESIGPASDVYLLGAVLFEIVTGSAPHSGEDAMACVLAAAKNEIQHTDQSGELLEIALRSMTTNPAERYASVKDLQAAIRKYQSHDESLALTHRAEQDMNGAIQTRDYQDFSRSLFGFEEAIALWKGNSRARKGLVAAKISYAQCALDRGDYELGLSLTDDQDPTQRDLRLRLQSLREEQAVRQRRLQNLKRLAALLVVSLFITVSAASAYFAYSRNELAKRESALANKNDELNASQMTLASRNKDLQQTSAELRKTNDDLLVTQDALEEEKNSLALAMNRELEQSYIAAIGLADEKIRNFAMGDARQSLTQYLQPHKNSLRHWEWGHLMFLCRREFKQLDWPERIESVAFSPDGKQMAFGDSNGECNIVAIDYDASERSLGQPRLSFRHGGSVRALAFTPEGRYVATAGADAEFLIKIWDTATPAADAQPVATLPKHTGPINCLEFSRDGQRIISASDDGYVYVWKLDWPAKSGETIRFFCHFPEKLHSARFSHDGSRIVIARDDGVVSIADLNSSQEERRLIGHGSAVRTASLSQDGQQCVSGDDEGRLLMWSLRSGSEEGDPSYRSWPLGEHAATVRFADFLNSEGDVVVSVGHDNAVRLWDASRNRRASELLRQLQLRQGKLTSSDDTATRASELGEDNSATDRLLLTLRGHGGWVTCGSVSPENSAIVATGGYFNGGQVKIWNIADYYESRPLRGHTGPVQSVAVSPDGKFLASAGTSSNGQGEAIVWNLARGQELSRLEEGHAYLAMRGVFAPPGNGRDEALLATIAGDGSLSVWNTASGGQQFRRNGMGWSGAIAASPDGKSIAAATASGSIVILESASGAVIEELRHDNGGLLKQTAVTAAEFSPDGRCLLTGDGIGRCVLWKLDQNGSWKFGRQLAGHAPGSSISSIAFLPNSKTVLTASADRSAAWWDVATGDELKSRRLMHPGPVIDLAVDPGGEFVVTACTEIGGQLPDGTASGRRSVFSRLWLWDASSGRLIRSTTRDDAIFAGRTVSSVSFDEEGAAVLVATASNARQAGRLYTWSIDGGATGELLAGAGNLGAIWSAVFVPAEIAASAILTVGGNQAQLWSLNANAALQNFAAHRSIHRIRFSDDGRQLATVGKEGGVKLWERLENSAWEDAAVKHKWPSMTDGAAIVEAVFVPAADGESDDLLFLGENGRCEISDANGQQRELFPELQVLGAMPTSVAVSRRDPLIAVGLADGRIRVWDVANSAWHSAWEERSANVSAAHGRNGIADVAFDVDAKRLVTVGTAYTAVVWDMASAQELFVLTGHTAPVTSVAISPDGKRVVTGSEDRTAKLWNIDETQPTSNAANDESARVHEILTLKGHRSAVNSVTFSRDGRYLITGGSDGLCLIWEADEVTALAFSTGVLEYSDPGKPVFVDRFARFSAPTRSGLAGLELTVALEGGAVHETEGIHFSLSNETQNAPGNVWTNEGGELISTGTNGQAMIIGAVAERRDDGKKLVIRFSENATPQNIESVVHGIAYQPADSSVSGPITNGRHDHAISFKLGRRDAESGSYKTSERVIIRYVPANGPKDELLTPNNAQGP